MFRFRLKFRVSYIPLINHLSYADLYKQTPNVTVFYLLLQEVSISFKMSATDKRSNKVPVQI